MPFVVGVISMIIIIMIIVLLLLLLLLLIIIIIIMLLPQIFSDVTLIGTACPRQTLIQQQANPLIWANLQFDKDKKSMIGPKTSLNPLE